MNKCYGFGVEPAISQNHFYVVVIGKKKSEAPVKIFERFSWTPKEETHEKNEEVIFADNQMVSDADVLKIEISRHKWDMVAKDLAVEFNARLKAERKPSGKFVNGGTPVERMFGKEMMILLWAIEDCDPSVIPKALQNWKGLLPEERWWLYTMTNASSGQLNDRYGWRVALRYALCENPILEEKVKQYKMFED